MWSPTHVQVLVKRAKGLNIKGKNGTNDCFVTIAMAKEKYQTSVKEKSGADVEWCEQCELTIPDKSKAEICLTALHRNFLGVDEFLGQVNIPLSDFDVYERPKTKWYTLKCKPGQKKAEYRGELEVKTAFTVKSVSKELGSTSDLSSKKEKGHKGSLQSLHKAGSKIGGSLMSLGGKDKTKNLKKLAKTVGSKVEKVGEKAKKSLSKTNLSGKDNNKGSNLDLNSSFGAATLPSKMKVKDFDPEGSFGSGSSFRRLGSDRKNRDPGVQSDDEDDMFKFDALSHRSSGSSLNVTGGNQSNLASSTGFGLRSSKHSIAESIEDDIGLTLSARHRNSGRSANQDQSTPGSGRRNPDLGLGTPRSSRSFLLDSGLRNSDRKANRKTSEPVLDEWEAKLLGKKAAAPFKNPDLDFDTKSTASQLSQGSHSSFSVDRSRVQEQSQPSSRKPSNAQETPSGRRKIIPTGKEFDGLTSPESPSAPEVFSTPKKDSKSNLETSMDSHNRSSFSQQSKRSSQGFDLDSSDTDLEDRQRKKTIGLKLKNSYSFKDSEKKLASSKDLRVSNESLNKHHSRNISDGSMAGHSAPLGTRVVLGRETTPTPKEHGPHRLPKDVWNSFEGRSREDLIEMVITLQDQVEKQAKKQSELEDYLDTLLMKVMANAPDLLQKNAQMEKKFGRLIQ